MGELPATRGTQSPPYLVYLAKIGTPKFRLEYRVKVSRNGQIFPFSVIAVSTGPQELKC